MSSLLSTDSIEIYNWFLKYWPMSYKHSNLLIISSGVLMLFFTWIFLKEFYYKNLQIYKMITHQNWSDCKSIQANEQLELALLYYIISQFNIIISLRHLKTLCLFYAFLFFCCTILDYSNNVEQELRTDIFALFLIFEGNVQSFINMILIF